MKDLLRRYIVGVVRMGLMYSLMGVMGWDDALYLMIASFLISYALTPKPKNEGAGPTAFDDIDFPKADEGTPQAVIFGDCWSGDWMVLAVGNYKVDEIHAGGGKK